MKYKLNLIKKKNLNTLGPNAFMSYLKFIRTLHFL